MLLAARIRHITLCIHIHQAWIFTYMYMYIARVTCTYETQVYVYSDLSVYVGTRAHGLGQVIV